MPPPMPWTRPSTRWKRTFEPRWRLQGQAEGRERLEEEPFERIPDLEDDEEEGHEDADEDDVPVERVHDDGVDPLVPGDALPPLHAAALLGDLEGQVMALRGDDLVSRHAPAGLDLPPGRAPPRFLSPGSSSPSIVSQKRWSASIILTAVNLRPATSGKSSGKQPGHLLDAVLDVPRPGRRLRRDGPSRATRNASSRSSLTPRPRTAMTGTTGTPSRADELLRRRS